MKPGAQRLATVADTVAAWLVGHGGRCVFTVASFHASAILNALAREIDVVPAAIESSAGFMADGVARSGGVGVLLTGGGPGLSAALPALRLAAQEGSPVLALVGQSWTTGGPRFQLTGADGSRDVEVLRSVVDDVLLVDDPSELEGMLEQAGEALAAGRPVVVAIPADVQSAPVPGADEPLATGLRREEAVVPTASVPTQRGGPVSTAPTGPVLGYADVVAGVAAAGRAGVVFVDAGQVRHAARRSRLSFVDCPRTAPMGWALPAAVGAAVAADGPTTALIGDGAAMVSGTELATAAACGADVRVVVCENRVWGGPYQRHLESPASGVGELPAVDWVAFSRSLGVSASRVSSQAGLTAFLDEGSPGPRVAVVGTPRVDDTVTPPY